MISAFSSAPTTKNFDNDWSAVDLTTTLRHITVRKMWHRQVSGSNSWRVDAIKRPSFYAGRRAVIPSHSSIFTGTSVGREAVGTFVHVLGIYIDCDELLRTHFVKTVSSTLRYNVVRRLRSTVLFRSVGYIGQLCCHIEPVDWSTGRHHRQIVLDAECSSIWSPAWFVCQRNTTVSRLCFVTGTGRGLWIWLHVV